MQALARVIRGGYVVGALGARNEAATFYAALGWRRWQGSTSALTPSGVRRTPEEDGSVYVLEVACELDFSGELVCD
jgi:aminoglycoside 2'-N-acetyltransferase I